MARSGTGSPTVSPGAAIMDPMSSQAPVAALDDLDDEQREAVLAARAETQTVRRRLEKDIADARAYAATGFARDILSVADNLTRALDARDGASARLLVAATALHRPEAEPGSLGALGEDLVLRVGTYDRFSMMRRDGLAWIDALGRLLDQLRPDVVHLHGLDRIGAGVLPVIRRHAPRARVVLTLHDYQFICVNDGLMLTAPEGARCHGARPDACRRCVPDLDAAHHALRKAALIAILQGVDAFVAPSAFATGSSRW